MFKKLAQAISGPQPIICVPNSCPCGLFPVCHMINTYEVCYCVQR